MKTPTLKIGAFNIKYIQVPYDNRYFVFTRQYDKRQSVKIEAYKNDMVFTMIKGIIERESKGEYWTSVIFRNRYGRFIERVEKKDKWLDRNELRGNF